ncbi:MAG: Ig-like domain-containing protein, partial [Clostridia bacterium]|nr:Ig-like domain-containing protein [Clostridia bacterium]
MKEKKTVAAGGGERLRSAMSLLDDRWIDEAEGGTAVAPRKKSGRGFRIAAIAAAAALLLAAVPLGIFIFLSGSDPDPELPEHDVSRGLSVLPEALRGVTVSADGAKGRIIPTDTAFIVKTSGEISPEELAANLSITPQTDFSVTRLASCKFSVAPATGKLNEGAIYRLSFGDPENPAISYAFQTDSQLMIRSFFPAAYSDGVPVDTAIVVSFSEVLDESACKQVALYPAVKGKAELISGGTAVVFLPDKELEPDTQYEIRVGDGIKSVSGRKLAQVSGATFRTAAAKELAGSFLFDPVAQNWKTFSPGDDASIEISFQKGISVIPAKADAEIF